MKQKKKTGWRPPKPKHNARCFLKKQDNFSRPAWPILLEQFATRLEGCSGNSMQESGTELYYERFLCGPAKI